ncbi:type II CAAX endopeptidase family protein [Lentisphaerota bacterium WC36G]|nr:CPBP family intramembrane metalloprotease [Lentisphaerae bacterium WC36]
MRYEKTLLPQKKYDFLMLQIVLGTIFFLFFLPLIFFGVIKLCNETLEIYFIAGLMQYSIISSIIFLMILSYKNQKNIFKRLGFLSLKWNFFKALPLIYIAIFLVMADISMISETVFLLFNWDIKAQIAGEMINQLDLLGEIVLGIIIVVLAPICEEVLFRRAVFSSLLPRTNKIIATIITSLLFALVHMDSFVTMPPLFALALILQFCYIHFKSIYAPIIIHFLNNLIAFSVIIAIKHELISDKIFT